MELGFILNNYLYRLDCTAKALADAAGVSPIQISRWRSGSRRPTPEMLRRLAAGIARLSNGELGEGEVYNELIEGLPAPKQPGTGFGRRLDLVLDVMKVHTSDISRVLNFDPSYLSRIRSGKRNPANIEPIIDGVSRYLVRRCASEAERRTVAELIGVDADAMKEDDDYFGILAAWLRSGQIRPIIGGADIRALLQALDSFDLNEYISAIRLDQQRPADVRGGMPPARSVSGLNNMMRCELDFLYATALADTDGSVMIYTDMPLTEMAKDPDYPKQWMQAVSALIKKGRRVDMLHNVDRPFEELLLGLEIHIPMYMTGRIAPYYLKENNAGPFRHLLEISDVAALSGEAIAGHHGEGRYSLTYDPEDLRYYRRRAAALMEKAAPLMDIYLEEREDEFRRFLLDEEAQGFTSVPVDMQAFRNITVQVCHDRWAVVMKDRSPRAAFVIRHPKLVDAIERFAAPLVDD